ncbi:hypothetical protein Nepgr_016139 [Nepenthes gracilis]|uniref:VQ domain-containing protein n=1 Tax=Nepenthes gracilis TaxID=150966 RepID=A0AAD3SM61_NEPGR|nr:hypothetical protein Nepgr_016139 [Nepenthes gracilis]
MASNTGASATTADTAAIKLPIIVAGHDPCTASSTTTFVQADPSNFRAVVQQLTGAPTSDLSGPIPDPHSFPSSKPARKPTTGDVGVGRPAFKLHERRQAMRKLDIELNDSCGSTVMVSPVSPLELLGRGMMISPRMPRSPAEEEERAIAEKGFYLHPVSPLSTPRDSQPQLLPLFPLHSPKDDDCC